MPAPERLSSEPETQDDVEASVVSSPNNPTPNDDDEHRQQHQTQADDEEEQGGGGGGELTLEEERRDSEESESESDESEDKPEFIFVQLQDIRKDVQCPICLGIIKKTRTMMECLHRFCRECIDKSMRLGNNECPACRTHCKSRRSLRDDPNYDALISALYPDIDKYEEEELAFHEEERARNKQIQASITEIFRRQSEALVKRPRRGNRGAASKRRRNSRGAEHSGSDDNEHVNDEARDRNSSSNDENNEESRPRQRKRRLGPCSSQPSPSKVNSDGLNYENGSEMSRESRVISHGRMVNPELLAWGRGRARSNIKSARQVRMQRLIKHFRRLDETAEQEIQVLLIPANKETTESLERPFLSVSANLTVDNLRMFISRNSPLAAEEIEILLVKAETNLGQGSSSPSFSEEQLQLLEDGHQTVREVLDGNQWARKEYTLAFRRKKIAQ